MTGAIAKVEPIAQRNGLVHAKSQKAAMDRAKIKLADATTKAKGQAKGEAAEVVVVSAMPELKDDRPEATIILLQGKKFSTASEARVGALSLQEDTMRTAPMWMSLVLTAGVVTIGLGVDSAGWSGVAIAQKRSHGAGSVDRIVSSLRAVDTAYASGNSAEAQTRFREARAAWNGVAPRISAREAREQQLLFDSLGNQIKNGVPAAKVRSTVSGMIDELHEDIERELR